VKLHATPFLGPPPPFGSIQNAKVVILPFGYEGGISYGAGAARAPQAVLEASQQVEFYDELLDVEPFRVGLATVAEPAIPASPERMMGLVESETDALLSRDKLVVLLGGDHSISPGYVRALAKRYPELGVIQLDAHADLRDSYEKSPLSHACAMARIREITPHTLQIGLRSMAAEEARVIKRRDLAVCTMDQWRRGSFNLAAALEKLPDQVFISLDVDVFDWSVIASTGTPEPGGLRWHEALHLLEIIFESKEVVGWDVVELAHQPHDFNSPFAAAKLIYKMIGFKYHKQLEKIS
jgi:agmatinase